MYPAEQILTGRGRNAPKTPIRHRPPGGRGTRQAVAVRAQLNRVIVVVALALGFPAVAGAERLRGGWGRVVADGLVAVVSRLCGIRFVVRGADRLDPAASYVFVANHTSPLDIPALFAAVPGVSFAAASELFEKPLLPWAMRALGVIPVDRQRPVAALRRLREVVRDADHLRLAIFPEGGIVPAGEERPFKSGAFALAVDAGVSIVPVAIRGAGDLLPPERFLAVRSGTVEIEVLTPISTDGVGPRDRPRLRDAAQAAVRAAVAGDAGTAYGAG